MLLAVDIGNSRTKFGIFNGATLLLKCALPTVDAVSPEAVFAAIPRLSEYSITSAIACSVVPPAESVITGFASDVLGVQIYFVRGTTDLGFPVRYQTRDTLGADRLINAFAALSKYDPPLIVAGLGTALTIDVIDAAGAYLGGIIAPGMKLAAAALHRETAALPQVEPDRPPELIGNSTENALRSGIYYGTAAMIEGLLKRAAARLARPCRTVLTGGLAEAMAAEIDFDLTIDADLTLDGLRLAHAKIAGRPLFK